MDRYTIEWFNLPRLLQGEVPWEFYIELIIRAAVVYLILIVALRLMGKRIARMFTRNELAAVSTLAAAIGIPLQSPDRGLVPGMLVAAIVVVVQRLVAKRTVKSQPFEQLTQGKISTLVEDGCLQPGDMKECRISRERIFSHLRGADVRQLGEVKRLYLEASGSFTLLRAPQPASGLCVLPAWDEDFVAEQQEDKSKVVCNYCGNPQPHNPASSCSNCGEKGFVKAIH
jgi:uncharacterized membrane protein YcaP (DUF421 family)